MKFDIFDNFESTKRRENFTEESVRERRDQRIDRSAKKESATDFLWLFRFQVAICSSTGAFSGSCLSLARARALGKSDYWICKVPPCTVNGGLSIPGRIRLWPRQGYRTSEFDALARKHLSLNNLVERNSRESFHHFLDSKIRDNGR